MAAGRNPSRRQQHIEAGPAAEIEHDLTGMQLGKRRGVAAAEAGAEGEAQVGDLGFRVFLLADGAADGIGSSATTRVAAAAPIAKLDRGFRVLGSDGLPNRVHETLPRRD